MIDTPDVEPKITPQYIVEKLKERYKQRVKEATVKISKIKCRRFSDTVEELWVINYKDKAICQAFTESRAVEIVKDTFPNEVYIIVR